MHGPLNVRCQFVLWVVFPKSDLEIGNTNFNLQRRRGVCMENCHNIAAWYMTWRVENYGTIFCSYPCIGFISVVQAHVLQNVNIWSLGLTNPITWYCPELKCVAVFDINSGSFVLLICLSRFVNPLEPELNAQCTLQETQNLSCHAWLHVVYWIL